MAVVEIDETSNHFPPIDTKASPSRRVNSTLGIFLVSCFFLSRVDVSLRRIRPLSEVTLRMLKLDLMKWNHSGILSVPRDIQAGLRLPYFYTWFLSPNSGIRNSRSRKSPDPLRRASTPTVPHSAPNLPAYSHHNENTLRILDLISHHPSP